MTLPRIEVIIGELRQQALKAYGGECTVDKQRLLALIEAYNQLDSIVTPARAFECEVLRETLWDSDKEYCLWSEAADFQEYLKALGGGKHTRLAIEVLE